MSPGEFFVWPGAWPLLLLAPAAWVLLWLHDRARARRLSRGLGPRGAALASDLSRSGRRLRRRLVVSAFVLALIAVLQPVWGEGIRRIEQRGVDILVCLDVSRSMLAADPPPSRLERARAEIRALAERARGDRMGLVVFAGEAALAVPLTQDLDTFLRFVDGADPLSVERGGTDLEAAIDAALAALIDREGDHEAVLLLTDGEDLEGRGAAAVERCRARGIAVHCVGFGSTQGSKIPVQEGEAFLRDKAGREVVSAMDPESLRRIAAATGGEFLEARGRPFPLVEIYEKRIFAKARRAFAAEERRERRNRYQWFLLAAFGLFCVELCMTDRRRA